MRRHLFDWHLHLAPFVCLSPFLLKCMRTSASFATAWVELCSSLPVFPSLSNKVLYLDCASLQHFNALHYAAQTPPCKHNDTVQTNNDNHIMKTSHTFWLLLSKLPDELTLSGIEEILVGKHLWVTGVSRSHLPRKQKSPSPGSSLWSASHCWTWVLTDLLLPIFAPVKTHNVFQV